MFPKTSDQGTILCRTVALQRSLCESLVGGESCFRLREAKENWEEAAWKWVSQSGQERLSGRQRQNLDLAPMETLPISPLPLEGLPFLPPLHSLAWRYRDLVEWRNRNTNVGGAEALLLASHQAEDKLPGLSETC